MRGIWSSRCCRRIHREAVAPLVDLAHAGKVPADREEAVLTVIATRGGPRELGMILDGVIGGKMPVERQESLLNALTQATRQRNVKPAGDLSQVGKLLDRRIVPLSAPPPLGPRANGG